MQTRARKARAGGRKAVRFEEEDEEEAEFVDASPPATHTKSRALRALRRGGMGSPVQEGMTSPGGAVSVCDSDVETEITQAEHVHQPRRRR